MPENAARSRTQPRSVAVALILAGVLASLITWSPAAEAQTGTAVMRNAQVSPAEMAAWFRSSSARVSGYRATVSVETLTTYYLQEGRDEGVAGDLAFVQAVLETGSFSWPGHGQVRAAQNNFAGIGACDGGTCTVATFRSARIGVRAQIQHLRAYADPTVTVARLAHPLESPRFHLVSPKGKARFWEQMGGGNWATDPNYSTKILSLYRSMRAHAAANPQPGTLSTTPSTTRFTDVPRTHKQFAQIESLAKRGITKGCSSTRFCPTRTLTRAETASLLVRGMNLPTNGTSRFTDVRVGSTHAGAISSLADRRITTGCSASRFCPDRAVTRGELAAFLQRAHGLAPVTPPFRDARNSIHAGAIGAAHRAGYLTGYSDGTFRPDLPISRAHAAAMLDRAL